MWENTVHFTNDFDRLLEINQYLTEVNNQTVNYLSDSRRVKRYQKMVDSPYFGRFDFLEEGFKETEKIYCLFSWNSHSNKAAVEEPFFKQQDWYSNV